MIDQKHNFVRLYTYRMVINNVEKDLLSVVDPDRVFSKGLAGKSIIGYLKNADGELVPENIIYNPDFIEVFKKTIESTALASGDLLKAATQQESGLIYLIDQRTKGQNETKPKDILGSFEVVKGQLIADSFQPNPNYEIISADGLFKLPDNFEIALLAALTD